VRVKSPPRISFSARELKANKPRQIDIIRRQGRQYTILLVGNMSDLEALTYQQFHNDAMVLV